MEEIVRPAVQIGSLVASGSALGALFLAWQWSRKAALGWLSFFFLSLAGIDGSLAAPPGPSLWIAGFSQTLYLVSLPGFVVTLTRTRVPRIFLGLYGIFSLLLVLAMPSPWKILGGLETVSAISAFSLTGILVLFLGFQVRRCQSPLPARLFRRFIRASALMLPLMACDSLGSTLGWDWICWFDQLALPVYLWVISVLVIAESRLWLWDLAQPAPKTPPEPGPPQTELSPRQREIADKLLQGLSTKEIADQLDISPKTAENHIYALYKRVGARSRLQFYHMVQGMNGGTKDR